MDWCPSARWGVRFALPLLSTASQQPPACGCAVRELRALPPLCAPLQMFVPTAETVSLRFFLDMM